jgi:hypothetical protein
MPKSLYSVMDQVGFLRTLIAKGLLVRSENDAVYLESIQLHGIVHIIGCAYFYELA